MEEERSTGPREVVREAVPWLKQRVRRACTRKMLFRRLPILQWLPRYTRSDFLGDLVAGITVGLTVIPQSLAYSNVAGLPAQVRGIGGLRRTVRRHAHWTRLCECATACTCI